MAQKVLDKETKASTRELFRAVLQPEKCRGMRAFFADLCTPAELWHSPIAGGWRSSWTRASLTERFTTRPGVSTATITRVARSLQYGEGGYRRVSKPPQAPKSQVANRE